MTLPPWICGAETWGLIVFGVVVYTFGFASGWAIRWLWRGGGIE